MKSEETAKFLLAAGVIEVMLLLGKAVLLISGSGFELVVEVTIGESGEHFLI